MDSIKKALVLFMLVMLIGPMLWGIWRVRRMPRDRAPMVAEDEE
jgi:hypothetical protein